MRESRKGEGKASRLSGRKMKKAVRKGERKASGLSGRKMKASRLSIKKREKAVKKGEGRGRKRLKASRLRQREGRTSKSARKRNKAVRKGEGSPSTLSGKESERQANCQKEKGIRLSRREREEQSDTLSVRQTGRQGRLIGESTCCLRQA